ncbi:MAG: hypothetical protein IMX00_11270 [Limnochordales bacterium]|nr:hypothetical protein [Limnochordales bacterium]
MRTVLLLAYLTTKARIRHWFGNPRRAVVVLTGLGLLSGFILWFVLADPQFAGVGALWGASSVAAWPAEAVTGMLLLYFGIPLALTFLSSAGGAPFYLDSSMSYWLALSPVSERAIASFYFFSGLIPSGVTAAVFTPLVTGSQAGVAQPIWSAWLALFSVSLWVKCLSYLLYFRRARRPGSPPPAQRLSLDHLPTAAGKTVARGKSPAQGKTAAQGSTAADPLLLALVAAILVVAVVGTVRAGGVAQFVTALGDLPPWNWLRHLLAGQGRGLANQAGNISTDLLAILALDTLAAAAVVWQARGFMPDLLERSEQQEKLVQYATQANPEALIATWYRVRGGEPPLRPRASGPWALSWVVGVSRLRFLRAAWKASLFGWVVSTALMAWGLGYLVRTNWVSPALLPLLPAMGVILSSGQLVLVAVQQPSIYLIPGSGFHRLAALTLPLAVENAGKMAVQWAVVAVWLHLSPALLLAGEGVMIAAALLQAGMAAWRISFLRSFWGRFYVSWGISGLAALVVAAPVFVICEMLDGSGLVYEVAGGLGAGSLTVLLALLIALGLTWVAGSRLGLSDI